LSAGAGALSGPSTDIVEDPHHHRPDRQVVAAQHLPRAVVLANPFNPRTTIRFTLATPGPVELSVYDLEGRVVRRLASGLYAAVVHELNWQGEDDHGAAAASGTCFYRLRAEGRELTRKMTLLR
jgi:hypothetical protein